MTVSSKSKSDKNHGCRGCQKGSSIAEPGRQKPRGCLSGVGSPTSRKRWFCSGTSAEVPSASESKIAEHGARPTLAAGDDDSVSPSCMFRRLGVS
jgi:hypothetical protein